MNKILKVDKEFSSNKEIEIGDAVLWKGVEKLGKILKKWIRILNGFIEYFLFL